MVEEIKTYKTKDGKTFTNEQDAELHEAKLALVQYVEETDPTFKDTIDNIMTSLECDDKLRFYFYAYIVAHKIASPIVRDPKHWLTVEVDPTLYEKESD